MERKDLILEHYDQNGFFSYRIPGVVVTAKGTVLAYYETRTNHGDDWSCRGVGMRRSTNGGLSFEPRVMLVEAGELPVNNPVMIASRDGRVHFLWQENYRDAFYQVSEDDGLSFSEPVCITKTFEALRSQLNWSLYALGPGHGIELRNGRLVIPVWIAVGKENDHHPTHISTIVSDDVGNTWHAGEVVFGSVDRSDAFSWPNETTAVELSDGSVMLNIRHMGTDYVRYISISGNGQDGFTAPRPDRQLPDAICFGSLVKANRDQDILFVNCTNREDAPTEGFLTGCAQRRNLTLHLSHDDAKTWDCRREIAYIGGYADLAVSPDGNTIYCFYEHERIPNSGDPGELVLTVLERSWLTDEEHT